jgi:flagellar basal body rod protein FlgG
MKNSIYSAAAGMLTSAERLNTIANNLANFSTNGYKGDIPFEQTIRFFANGPYPGKDQPVLGGNVIDMKNGLIKMTGRDLDLAFQGPGFFTVQGPDNQEFYTRNGAFTLNSQRELVTSDGFPIMDNFNRNITLFGEKFQISPRGEVFVDDAYYTTLKIVDIPDRDNLEKVGDTFFKLKENAAQPVAMENPQLLTGALEKSNVDLLRGITSTIKVQRSFDLQKTAADIVLKLLRKTITDVAKPV